MIKRGSRLKTVALFGAIVALLAMSAVPASAKKAAPVKTTLYFHGSPDDDLTLGALNMSPDKPTQATPASRALLNYVEGPRDDCVNDWVFSPLFRGNVSGHITGDVKVTLYAATTPGYVDVFLVSDFTDFLCGSKEHQPTAITRVQLNPGAGPTVAVIKNVDMDVQGVLSLSVRPVPQPPYVGRLLYDSPDFASKVEFTCAPAHGASCS